MALLPPQSPALLWITLADPGAGGSVNWDPPPRTRLRLLRVRVILQTDATVTNRYVRLEWPYAAGRYTAFPEGPAQTASLGWTYTWILGWPLAPVVNNLHVVMPLFPDAWFNDLEHLTIDARGMVGGDDFSSPSVLLEHHIEPST